MAKKEARMMMKEAQSKGGGRPGGSFREDCLVISREFSRRLAWGIQASVLSLCLWGCGTVPATPVSAPETPKPPAVAEQSMGLPGTGDTLEELKNYMTPHRTKLALAGGVVLLVTFLVGVGVGKSHKVAPAPEEAARA
jgi:hypothetical protein